MLVSPALRQAVRYGVVGLSHNSVGYLVYLFITSLGVDPKVVVSIGYPLGATISYFANKEWSFSYERRFGSSFLRYIISYFFAYVINLGLLYFFVDALGYPHELVQVLAIFSVALFLFLALRYFVFSEDKKR